MQQRVAEVEKAIARIIEELDRTDDEETQTDGGDGGGTGGDDGKAREAVMVPDFRLPAEISSRDDLDALIARLQALRTQFERYAKIVFKS